MKSEILEGALYLFQFHVGVKWFGNWLENTRETVKRSETTSKDKNQAM